MGRFHSACTPNNDNANAYKCHICTPMYVCLCPHLCACVHIWVTLSTGEDDISSTHDEDKLRPKLCGRCSNFDDSEKEDEAEEEDDNGDDKGCGCGELSLVTSLSAVGSALRKAMMVKRECCRQDTTHATEPAFRPQPPLPPPPSEVSAASLSPLLLLSFWWWREEREEEEEEGAKAKSDRPNTACACRQRSLTTLTSRRRDAGLFSSTRIKSKLHTLVVPWV